MNVIVPGTGLIVLGRPWLGVSVAIWYGIAAEGAAWGVLIAPATMPTSVTLGSLVLAGAAWVMGQSLLIARIRFLRDPNLADEMAILRRHAEAALARGHAKAARSTLRLALSIDDSDVPTRILWARLITETESRPRARRAWLGVARLEGAEAHTPEIRDAIRGLRRA